MPSLPIVITGTGRSGTTFLAHVFAKAGYDMGNVPVNLIGEGNRPSGGGLEWTPFRLINRQIFERLQNNEDPVDIANSIRSDIPLSFPRVIKHPLYIFTFHVWELAGYVPEQIFLCMRNPDATQMSFQKAFHGKGFIDRHLCAGYRLQAHALQTNIPFTPVVYPRIGQDAHYADTTLSPFIKNASEIVHDTWDTSLYSSPEKPISTIENIDYKIS